MRARPAFAVSAFRTALLASPDAVAAEFSKHRAIACANHLEPGTVLIFDVGYDIEHRVLPVTSGDPRCVYTRRFYKGAK